ncbi:hypothetical protein EJB05_14785, partial [Eragrostis curvula]
MEGIVSIFPSRTRELLTTRSWDFLGFPQTPPEALPLEGDIIVGMLDSGVWPDSPSFSDEGFGPPPSRWKGACHNFTCNNKIIGARAYKLGSHGSAGVSPLDEGGHGSHTASTVAGRAVGNVSFNGLAAGTARGAVPGARLAVYKVCWRKHCQEEDILAAFDDAIADGVDVISFSIGGLRPSPYFEDAAAIGSFHAMKRGVLTSAGAGNAGTIGGRVCNVAPWMLSVAASSIDRRFVDKIVLGNGDTIVGTSINTFPVVQNATLVFPNGSSCDPEDMAGGSYKGKIIVCPPKNGRGFPVAAGYRPLEVVNLLVALPKLRVLRIKLWKQDRATDEVLAKSLRELQKIRTLDVYVTGGDARREMHAVRERWTPPRVPDDEQPVDAPTAPRLVVLLVQVMELRQRDVDALGRLPALVTLRVEPRATPEPLAVPAVAFPRPAEWRLRGSSLAPVAGPFSAGAAGAVMAGNGLDVANAVPLPAIQMTQGQLDQITAYVNSTSNPVGTIDSTEAAVNPQAPVAASFSSPGPNLITPGILKPDLSAPGIDIIASWSPMSRAVGAPEDKRSVMYNIESGTSMACPHATGVAAYVKSFHRDWSPAMIMSALITTASTMNTSSNAGYSELKYGAGQLNPSKARDPGLVYDASEGDYVAMLCAQGYNATQLTLVTGSNATSCSGSGRGDLNYPTMAAHVALGQNFSLGFVRTVTNVGATDAVYNVEIIGVSSIDVTVAPERLEFSAKNRTATYTVSASGVAAAAAAADKVVSLAVVWSDGRHVVRSPLVVYTVGVDIPPEEMSP